MNTETVLSSERATERRSGDVDVKLRDELQMYVRSLNLTYNFDVQARLDSEFDIQFECSMSNVKYENRFESKIVNIKVMLIFDSAAERRASDFEEKCIILESDDEL